MDALNHLIESYKTGNTKVLEEIENYSLKQIFNWKKERKYEEKKLEKEESKQPQAKMSREERIQYLLEKVEEEERQLRQRIPSPEEFNTKKRELDNLRRELETLITNENSRREVTLDRRCSSGLLSEEEESPPRPKMRLERESSSPKAPEIKRDIGKNLTEIIANLAYPKYYLLTSQMARQDYSIWSDEPLEQYIKRTPERVKAIKKIGVTCSSIAKIFESSKILETRESFLDLIAKSSGGKTKDFDSFMDNLIINSMKVRLTTKANESGDISSELSDSIVIKLLETLKEEKVGKKEWKKSKNDRWIVKTMMSFGRNRGSLVSLAIAYSQKKQAEKIRNLCLMLSALVDLDNIVSSRSKEVIKKLSGVFMSIPPCSLYTWRLQEDDQLKSFTSELKKKLFNEAEKPECSSEIKQEIAMLNFAIGFAQGSLEDIMQALHWSERKGIAEKIDYSALVKSLMMLSKQHGLNLKNPSKNNYEVNCLETSPFNNLTVIHDIHGAGDIIDIAVAQNCIFLVNKSGEIFPLLQKPSMQKHAFMEKTEEEGKIIAINDKEIYFVPKKSNSSAWKFDVNSAILSKAKPEIGNIPFKMNEKEILMTSYGKYAISVAAEKKLIIDEDIKEKKRRNQRRRSGSSSESGSGSSSSSDDDKQVPAKKDQKENKKENKKEGKNLIKVSFYDALKENTSNPEKVYEFELRIKRFSAMVVKDHICVLYNQFNGRYQITNLKTMNSFIGKDESLICGLMSSDISNNDLILISEIKHKSEVLRIQGFFNFFLETDENSTESSMNNYITAELKLKLKPIIVKHLEDSKIENVMENTAGLLGIEPSENTANLISGGSRPETAHLPQTPTEIAFLLLLAERAEESTKNLAINQQLSVDAALRKFKSPLRIHLSKDCISNMIMLLKYYHENALKLMEDPKNQELFNINFSKLIAIMSLLKSHFITLNAINMNLDQCFPIATKTELKEFLKEFFLLQCNSFPYKLIPETKDIAIKFLSDICGDCLKLAPSILQGMPKEIIEKANAIIAKIINGEEAIDVATIVLLKSLSSSQVISYLQELWLNGEYTFINNYFSLEVHFIKARFESKKLANTLPLITNAVDAAIRGIIYKSRSSNTALSEKAKIYLNSVLLPIVAKTCGAVGQLIYHQYSKFWSELTLKEKEGNFGNLYAEFWINTETDLNILLCGACLNINLCLLVEEASGNYSFIADWKLLEALVKAGDELKPVLLSSISNEDSKKMHSLDIVQGDFLSRGNGNAETSVEFIGATRIELKDNKGLFGNVVVIKGTRMKCTMKNVEYEESGNWKVKIKVTNEKILKESANDFIMTFHPKYIYGQLILKKMLTSLIDASVILSSFAFDQVRSLEDKSNNLPVLYDDMLNSKLLSGGLPKSEFSTLFSKNFSDTFQKIKAIIPQLDAPTSGNDLPEAKNLLQGILIPNKDKKIDSLLEFLQKELESRQMWARGSNAQAMIVVRCAFALLIKMENAIEAINICLNSVPYDSDKIKYQKLLAAWEKASYMKRWLNDQKSKLNEASFEEGLQKIIKNVQSITELILKFNSPKSEPELSVQPFRNKFIRVIHTNFQKEPLIEKKPPMPRIEFWKHIQRALQSKKVGSIKYSMPEHVLVALKSDCDTEKFVKILEKYYVRGLILMGSLTIMNQAFSGLPYKSIRMYVLKMIMLIFQRATTESVHYSSMTIACGREFQLLLSMIFGEFYRAILEYCITSNNNDELLFMLHSLKWNFTATDHTFLKESECLYKLSPKIECYLTESWKFYKKNSIVDNPEESTLQAVLLETFGFLTAKVLMRTLTGVQEEAIVGTPMRLVRYKSTIKEGDAREMIEHALEVIFSEIAKASHDAEQKQHSRWVISKILNLLLKLSVLTTEAKTDHPLIKTGFTGVRISILLRLLFARSHPACELTILQLLPHLYQLNNAACTEGAAILLTEGITTINSKNQDLLKILPECPANKFLYLLILYLTIEKMSFYQSGKKHILRESLHAVCCDTIRKILENNKEISTEFSKTYLQETRIMETTKEDTHCQTVNPFVREAIISIIGGEFLGYHLGSEGNLVYPNIEKGIILEKINNKPPYSNDESLINTRYIVQCQRSSKETISQDQIVMTSNEVKTRDDLSLTAWCENFLPSENPHNYNFICVDIDLVKWVNSQLMNDDLFVLSGDNVIDTLKCRTLKAINSLLGNNQTLGRTVYSVDLLRHLLKYAFKEIKLPQNKVKLLSECLIEEFKGNTVSGASKLFTPFQFWSLSIEKSVDKKFIFILRESGKFVSNPIEFPAISILPENRLIESMRQLNVPQGKLSLFDTLSPDISEKQVLADLKIGKNSITLIVSNCHEASLNGKIIEKIFVIMKASETCAILLEPNMFAKLKEMLTGELQSYWENCNKQAVKKSFICVPLWVLNNLISLYEAHSTIAKMPSALTENIGNLEEHQELNILIEDFTTPEEWKKIKEKKMIEHFSNISDMMTGRAEHREFYFGDEEQKINQRADIASQPLRKNPTLHCPHSPVQRQPPPPPPPHPLPTPVPIFPKLGLTIKENNMEEKKGATVESKAEKLPEEVEIDEQDMEKYSNNIFKELALRPDIQEKKADKNRKIERVIELPSSLINKESNGIITYSDLLSDLHQLTLRHLILKILCKSTAVLKDLPETMLPQLFDLLQQYYIEGEILTAFYSYSNIQKKCEKILSKGLSLHHSAFICFMHFMNDNCAKLKTLRDIDLKDYNNSNKEPEIDLRYKKKADIRLKSFSKIIPKIQCHPPFILLTFEQLTKNNLKNILNAKECMPFFDTIYKLLFFRVMKHKNIKALCLTLQHILKSLKILLNPLSAKQTLEINSKEREEALKLTFDFMSSNLIKTIAMQRESVSHEKGKILYAKEAIAISYLINDIILEIFNLPTILKYNSTHELLPIFLKHDYIKTACISLLPDTSLLLKSIYSKSISEEANDKELKYNCGKNSIVMRDTGYCLPLYEPFSKIDEILLVKVHRMINYDIADKMWRTPKSVKQFSSELTEQTLSFNDDSPKYLRFPTIQKGAFGLGKVDNITGNSSHVYEHSQRIDSSLFDCDVAAIYPSFNKKEATVVSKKDAEPRDEKEIGSVHIPKMAGKYLIRIDNSSLGSSKLFIYNKKMNRTDENFSLLLPEGMSLITDCSLTNDSFIILENNQKMKAAENSEKEKGKDILYCIKEIKCHEDNEEEHESRVNITDLPIIDEAEYIISVHAMLDKYYALAINKNTKCREVWEITCLPKRMAHWKKVAFEASHSKTSLAHINILSLYNTTTIMIALSDTGSVYSWGTSKNKLLGHYDEKGNAILNQPTPKIIQKLVKFKISQISLSETHWLALGTQCDLPNEIPVVLGIGDNSDCQISGDKAKSSVKIILPNAICPYYVYAGERCSAICFSGKSKITTEGSTCEYTHEKNIQGPIFILKNEKEEVKCWSIDGEDNLPCLVLAATHPIMKFKTKIEKIPKELDNIKFDIGKEVSVKCSECDSMIDKNEPIYLPAITSAAIAKGPICKNCFIIRAFSMNVCLYYRIAHCNMIPQTPLPILNIDEFYPTVENEFSLWVKYNSRPILLSNWNLFSSPARLREFNKIKSEIKLITPELDTQINKSLENGLANNLRSDFRRYPPKMLTYNTSKESINGSIEELMNNIEERKKDKFKIAGDASQEEAEQQEKEFKDKIKKEYPEISKKTIIFRMKMIALLNRYMLLSLGNVITNSDWEDSNSPVQSLATYKLQFSAAISSINYSMKKWMIPGIKSKLLSIIAEKMRRFAQGRSSSSSSDNLEVVHLNHCKANKLKSNNLEDVEGNVSLFGQLMNQISNPVECFTNTRRESSRSENRCFKVHFQGEGGIDAGGLYRDAISQIAEELQSSILPLLIPTPNNKISIGECREKFTINPCAKGATVNRLYEFFGQLLGMGFNTTQVIPLNLSSLFWKKLLGEELTFEDLDLMDTSFTHLLDSLKDPEKLNEMGGELSYIITLSNGTEKEVIKGGKSIKVTPDNVKEYYELAIQSRLTEGDQQIEYVKKGFYSVVPEIISKLFSWSEVETRICGETKVDVNLLRSRTECNSRDKVIEWFWEVLREFSEENKELYLRFVSGLSRMPTMSRNIRHEIHVIDYRENILPTSHTCNAQLELPRYPSKALLKEKLLYAIRNCRGVDLDGEARGMEFREEE